MSVGSTIFVAHSLKPYSVLGHVEINKNFSYAVSQDLAEVEGHEDYH